MRMCPADEVFRNGPIFEIWIGPGLNLPGLGWIGPKAQENFRIEIIWAFNMQLSQWLQIPCINMKEYWSILCARFNISLASVVDWTIWIIHHLMDWARPEFGPISGLSQILDWGHFGLRVGPSQNGPILPATYACLEKRGNIRNNMKNKDCIDCI